jgi:hypothetical protein
MKRKITWTYYREIGKVAQKPIRQVPQIHVENLVSGKRRDAGSESEYRLKLRYLFP